ncbi:non-ribosomal peptide synthetase [Streptomyces sp. AS58]|nr:non-ribosomal peptide synthetase [Streptomyces sp. AS58]
MLPLSFGQRRLWFLDRLEGSGAGYNLPLALRLTGNVDIGALRSALADVVERHEPLRTRFPDHDGEPYQHILPPEAARPRLTVTAVPTERLAATVAATVAEAFDLGARPPVRAALFTSAPDDHLFLLVIHHIAMDGWSRTPLLTDLARAYRTRTAGAGTDVRAAELPLGYTDYALWQRELLDTPGVRDPQTAFWRRTLEGLSPTTALPADHPRPAVASHRGARVPLHCSGERYRRLLELAREEHCTPFMAVHAALAMLLARTGGEHDIRIGSVVSGRTERELHPLVGFFVNTLVLRTDLSGDPSFREVLTRVRVADLDAFAHQDLPFDLVVEALSPDRSPAYHPLFQVLLAFQSHEDERYDFGPVRAETWPVASPTAAKVDLTFQLEETGEGSGRRLDGYLEYATDLFCPATAEALAARLLRVVDAVTAEPQCPLSRLDLLGPDERRRVLVEWNATARDLPVTTLPDALAAQAVRTPHATALICGDTTLTYDQLHEQADLTARRLVGLGATAGDVVAVALPRSIAFVTALLGVLKAGCAYLPLDPGQPTRRHAGVLAEVRPVCVLTDGPTRARLPAVPAPVLRVDDPAAAPPAELRRPAITPGHPAYVLYTSGSTGRPKGVVVSHGAIDNRLRWMQAAYPLAPGDRVLHKTPCGFDVSVWELLWPLREGGVLVLAAPDEHRDPVLLARTIRERLVTVAHFVPSMLDAFLAEADAGVCGVLRRVICSGEALARETVRRFHRVLPGVTLENLYGPTEAAIDVTYHSCRPGDEGPVPIGRPVWNTRVYVLDEHLRPTPPGTAGELYLAGAQLGTGYLRQGAATATRFVADPYGPPGTRMYRTGDIARWRTDSTVEYLGRADNQVKLRGQRIEPGEIESWLTTDATVGTACCVLRSEGAGGARLVAYVTPASGGTRPDSDRLLEGLRTELPAFMVPSAVVVLARLPVTVNGKLDRAALPAPAPLAPVRVTTPRTPQEDAVAGAVARTLGLPSVDVKADFFRQGGTSMLAIRLAARLSELTGGDIPVQEVFRRPTAAALTRHLFRLGGAETHDGTAPLLPLRTQGTDRPLFLVHPGTGLSWCYFRLLPHLPSTRPVYGLQARGLTTDRRNPEEHDNAANREKPPQTIEEMAEDYVALIRQVQPSGPYDLLGWSFGGLVAHAMATRLQSDGEDVARLVVLDARPEPAGTNAITQDDVALLSLALRNLLGGAPRPPSEAALFDAIRERFPPLAGADADSIQAAVRVGMNNLRLMDRFVPGRFRGDLMLLTALSGASEGNGEGGPSAAWQPYIDGRVRERTVDCHHFEMLDAGLPEVGWVLAAVLQGSGNPAREGTT